MNQVKKHVLQFILLGFVGIMGISCEEDTEYLPSAMVDQPANTVILVDNVNDEYLELEEEDRGRWSDHCTLVDKVEFDVYDSDPEFVNPKNYRIILSKNGRILKRAYFSQYCTLNNTTTFEQLPAGNYEYVISSSCTDKVYRGKINYTGGYQAYSIYIDQEFCD